MKNPGIIVAGYFHAIPLRALSVCSLLAGWILFYFFNISPWNTITGGSVDSDSVRFFFFGGLLAGLFGGLFFTRRFNVKGVLIGFTTATSAMVLAIRYLSIVRLAGGWGYGLFGLLAGCAYGGMFHIWIFAFPAVPRIASVAAVHLASGAVSLAILWIGDRFGVIGATLSDIIIPLLVIGAIARLDMSRVDDPGKAERLPFPRRLTGIVILTLLLFYLSSYLPDGLLASKAKGAWSPSGPGIRFLISSSVYLLFLFFGEKIQVLVLLYTTILLQLIGFGLIMLNIEAPYGPMILVVADSIGNLFLFILIFDILHKHRRRTMIGALFAGAVAVGTAAGMLIGWTLDVFNVTGPGVFIGMMVVFYASSLGLLPLLLKVLEKELAFRLLAPESPADITGLSVLASDVEEEGAVSILDPAYIREPMGRKIRRLNERFDPPYRLTTREIEIAALLAGRLDYKSIARGLYISVNTLKVHAKSVYRKFDVSGRKGLIELCLEPDRVSCETKVTE